MSRYIVKPYKLSLEFYILFFQEIFKFITRYENEAQQPGSDISVPLRFLNSRNIWSAEPDINNNTNSNESSIQIGGPERNLFDGQQKSQ